MRSEYQMLKFTEVELHTRPRYDLPPHRKQILYSLLHLHRLDVNQETKVLHWCIRVCVTRSTSPLSHCPPTRLFLRLLEPQPMMLQVSSLETEISDWSHKMNLNQEGYVLFIEYLAGYTPETISTKGRMQYESEREPLKNEMCKIGGVPF